MAEQTPAAACGAAGLVEVSRDVLEPWSNLRTSWRRARPAYTTTRRAKVAEYVAAGAACPILHPLGDDVEFMVDTLPVRIPGGEGHAR